MDRGAWGKPVVLEIYGRPGTVAVSDTLDAALFLLSGWNGKRTDTYMTAVATCRETLRGRATPSLSRAAFIDAALDAGYHIQPETFLAAQWHQAPVPDLRPGFGLGEHSVPVALSSPKRWADAPSISAPSPAAVAPRMPEPQPEGMPALLGRLGEIVGLILMEMVRNAAGMLNIGVRQRQPRGWR